MYKFSVGVCSHPCPHANVFLPPFICQILISKYLISVGRLITLGRGDCGGGGVVGCDWMGHANKTGQCGEAARNVKFHQSKKKIIESKQ